MALSAREAAMVTLSDMESRKAWSNGRLKQVIRNGRLDSREAALATRLCLGVLQNRLLLDYYLQHFSAMKLERMERKVLANLRIGLYQLLFLEKIPARAAVNEAVALTKRHCKNPKAAGMVNGILRSIEKNLTGLPPLPEDKGEALSIRYSHPKWLVDLFAGQLQNEEELENLLTQNNTEAPVTVQVNTCRFTQEKTIAALEAEGVRAKPHPWLPNCLLLADTGDITCRRAWQEGMFYPQDPAARLAVLAAGVKPGDRVLDTCAAPGGKSFAAAMDLENEGNILSGDIHRHKKALMEAGAARLGLKCVEACTMDATRFVPNLAEAFDVVLADVPCSGLGVLRKKPEIRYKDPRELATLPELQREILQNVSCYVRPGGTLLYATCTLSPRENGEVVSAFLKEHKNFVLTSFTLPGPAGEVREGQITLWPQRLGTDGFFIARLEREESV